MKPRLLFKRLEWRAQNLTPSEFRASLRPRKIVLEELRRTDLLARAPRPAPAVAPHSAYPFLLIGPGALGHETIIFRRLRSAGATPLASHLSHSYPAIAWHIYGLHAGSSADRKRNLLRFNLDRVLYGKRAHLCRIVFFDADPRLDLRAFKKKLRQSIGPIRFYSVRYEDIEETSFTSFVHMPDRDRIPIECGILRAHGMPGVNIIK